MLLSMRDIYSLSLLDRLIAVTGIGSNNRGIHDETTRDMGPKLHRRYDYQGPGN